MGDASDRSARLRFADRSPGGDHLSRLIVLVVVGALSAAACGATSAPLAASAAPTLEATSTSTSTASVSPSLAPSAPPSPSPSLPPTQEQIRLAARQAYLNAVTPANKARLTLYRQYKNATSLKSLKAYCGKLADASRLELAALNMIVYPDDTKADAKVLIRLDAAIEVDLRSCSKSTSMADWNHWYSIATKANERGAEAANLVRLDLGLPSNVK
jgi:hypothetical protein